MTIGRGVALVVGYDRDVVGEGYMQRQIIIRFNLNFKGFGHRIIN